MSIFIDYTGSQDGSTARRVVDGSSGPPPRRTRTSHGHGHGPDAPVLSISRHVMSYITAGYSSAIRTPHSMRCTLTGCRVQRTHTNSHVLIQFAVEPSRNSLSSHVLPAPRTNKAHLACAPVARKSSHTFPHKRGVRPSSEVTPCSSASTGSASSSRADPSSRPPPCLS